VIDSSVGKATIPGQISRAGIRDIARVEVMQALRDQRPSIISEVAPVVKREVLSMVTELIQNEVAAECQRLATEAASESIQHCIDGNKRQQGDDRRSILLSGILADERPGSPRPARQGSTKGNTQTGVKEKGEARR